MTFPNYHSTHSHQLHDHPHHVLTRGRIQEHQDFELMPSPLCPSAKSMLTCPPAGEGAPAVLSGSAHMPFLYPPHIDHSNFQAYDTVLVSSSPKAHSSGGIRPDRNHHQQLQKEMEYAAAENAHCGAYYAPSMCGNRVSVDDCNVEDEIINHNGLSNMEEEPQECQTFGVDGDIMKKGRRLGLDQVKALEKAFEVENRLEPERKVRLAVQLGLQPRQVAVWFQNRRARWKTKQMERDYNVLKSKFEALKADRDKLMTEKEKLRAEVDRLREHNGVEVATTERASPQNRITDSPGTLASCSGSIEASTLKRGSTTLLGHEQLSLVLGGTAADGAAGSNDPCGMHQDNAKKANKSSLQGSSTGIINENGSLSSSDAEHEYVSDDGGAIVDSSTSISKIVTGLIINNPSPRHLQHDAMPHHEFLPRSKAVVSSEDDDDHDHLHLDLCNSNWRLAAAPSSYQINQVAAAPTNHQINQLHKTMIKSEELNHLDEEQDHINLAYLHHQQANFSVPFEWYWSTM